MAAENFIEAGESGTDGLSADLGALGVDPQGDGLQPERSEQNTETETEATPTTEKAATKATFGEEDVSRIVGGILANLPQPPAPAQQQKEYTPEELDTLFNVFKPSAEMVEAIREGGEGALTAMAQLRDGVVKQMNTIQEYRLQTMKEEILAAVQPGIAATQAAAREKAENEFYSANKDLEPHKDMVALVINDFKARNITFPDTKSAATKIVEVTRALLKSKGVTTTAPNGSGQPQMASLAGSGGGSPGSVRPSTTGVQGDLKNLFG